MHGNALKHKPGKRAAKESAITTPQQFNRVWNATDPMNPKEQLVLVLSSFLGFREGEIAHSKREWFNLGYPYTSKIPEKQVCGCPDCEKYAKTVMAKYTELSKSELQEVISKSKKQFKLFSPEQLIEHVETTLYHPDPQKPETKTAYWRSKGKWSMASHIKITHRMDLDDGNTPKSIEYDWDERMKTTIINFFSTYPAAKISRRGVYGIIERLEKRVNANRGPDEPILSITPQGLRSTALTNLAHKLPHATREDINYLGGHSPNSRTGEKYRRAARISEQLQEAASKKGTI